MRRAILLRPSYRWENGDAELSNFGNQDQGQLPPASAAHARLHFRAHHRLTWGTHCVDSGSHRGTRSPKATPAGAAPVRTLDAVTTHCLLVSDSLSQDSPGLAVGFLPAAGGFRAKATPPHSRHLQEQEWQRTRTDSRAAAGPSPAAGMSSPTSPSLLREEGAKVPFLSSKYRKGNTLRTVM